MISKRNKKTILTYCIAVMMVLTLIASNVTLSVTHLETNTKKIVADNNYIETNEISYGLVALEASSSIEEKKKAEEEARRIAEEEARRKAEEEARRKAEEEARRKKAEEEARRKKAEEEARRKAQQAAAKKNNQSTSAPQPPASTGDKSLGERIANYALQFNGNPYKSGGTSLTNGADCSGFVQTLYKTFGISIPRGATSQSRAGRYVSVRDLQPGDLVFYSYGDNTIQHVAMYIGNGKIIHAQTPRDGIGIDPVNCMKIVTARRYV